MYEAYNEGGSVLVTIEPDKRAGGWVVLSATDGHSQADWGYLDTLPGATPEQIKQAAGLLRRYGYQNPESVKPARRKPAGEWAHIHHDDGARCSAEIPDGPGYNDGGHYRHGYPPPCRGVNPTSWECDTKEVEK